LLVPGGTFYRGYDGVVFTDDRYPATVADFYLDKYEITVGRFRKFVEAGMGNQDSPPEPGAGAHPLIPGSGWKSTWTPFLPWTTTNLKAELECQFAFQTWTDKVGSNESRPINCLDWFAAAAFCAWDGGRLATSAEWNYAAAGGSEQRYYPWSNPPTSTIVNDSYAVYCGNSCDHPQNVGAKSPKGDGKWGHADLGGNVWEWVLDGDAPFSNPCDNCADLVESRFRVLWGGGFDVTEVALRGAQHLPAFPDQPYLGWGARCARSGP
jgi:sulfatase modifying factor 1